MSQTVLQPSQISWRTEIPRRRHGPLGLKNLGNTCYFNSVLQCLTYTPPLANLCLAEQHSLACGARNDRSNSNCAFCFLERRIRSSLTTDVAVDSPAKILDSLHRSTKLFRVGRQEDAHELLRYSIEACNNACIQLQKPLAAISRQAKHGGGKPKEEPHTVVKEIFGGVLQSQVKCQDCGTESNKLDEIMDLSLDIMPRLVSLREAVCRFFQPEVLDGDNKYQCSECRKPTAARKQLSVFKAPNVLVIQLKRFENIYGGKIDRHIAFEERLSLAGHMCRNSKDARPEYSLYGVVVHSGHSQDGGHYYAYVKEQRGKWYCCNDASVCHVSSEEVRADKAYILFYLRSNNGPDVFAATRTDSTPSPPNTPDTELQEPPKKYSSTPSATYSKLSNSTLVNSRVSSKKMRFKIGNVNDPPEKGNREKQSSNKPSSESSASTCISVPKQLGCSDSARHSYVGLSAPCVLKPEQHAGSSFDVSSPSRRCGSDENSLPNVSSLGRDMDKRQGGELMVGQITNTGSVGNEVRGNTSGMCIRRESGDASRNSYSDVGLSAGGHPAKSFQHETRNSGAKRPRDEAQFTAVFVEGAASVPLLDTQVGSSVQRQGLKSVDEADVSDISSFKYSLEIETREELLRRGWCEKVRARLRAVKRSRMSNGLWPADASEQASRSRQLFDEEREYCKNLVPKESKEHLVVRSFELCRKRQKTAK